MGYSAAQAARLAGCSLSQVRHWSRRGLAKPGPDGYTFGDLVALRIVRSLLESGLSLARVRAALDHLTAGRDDVAGLRLVTDGVHVWACREDGQLLDALRGGQLVLFLAVDRFAADVEAEVRSFERERRAFVRHLRGGARADRDGGAGSGTRPPRSASPRSTSAG